MTKHKNMNFKKFITQFKLIMIKSECLTAYLLTYYSPTPFTMVSFNKIILKPIGV